MWHLVITALLLTFSFGQSAEIRVDQSQLKMLQRRRRKKRLFIKTEMHKQCPKSRICRDIFILLHPVCITRRPYRSTANHKWTLLTVTWEDADSSRDWAINIAVSGSFLLLQPSLHAPVQPEDKVLTIKHWHPIVLIVTYPIKCGRCLQRLRLGCQGVACC